MPLVNRSVGILYTIATVVNAKAKSMTTMAVKAPEEDPA